MFLLKSITNNIMKLCTYLKNSDITNNDFFTLYMLKLDVIFLKFHRCFFCDVQS